MEAAPGYLLHWPIICYCRKMKSLNPARDHGVIAAFVLVTSAEGLEIPLIRPLLEMGKRLASFVCLILFSVSFSFLVGYSNRVF
jgi:hypothetical protein